MNRRVRVAVEGGPKEGREFWGGLDSMCDDRLRRRERAVIMKARPAGLRRETPSAVGERPGAPGTATDG
jgi:hypothetical protein